MHVMDHLLQLVIGIYVGVSLQRDWPTMRKQLLRWARR